MATEPLGAVEGGSGIDLVIPAFDEELELPATLDSLARQVDFEGRPLPPGAFRIVAVDNASRDGTRAVLERAAADPDLPDITVVDEPEKGVVAARITGSRVALEAERRRGHPWLAHGDADNRFPPTFVAELRRRLAAGTEVVTTVGVRGLDFWRRVPRLAERYYREIGTIHFDDATCQALGFDPQRALFSRRIWNRFEQVPMQCGLAMTKAIFERAGGYVRELDAEGNERLGEARNLMYRFDRIGARLDRICEPAIQLNPRRLLLEAAVWQGASYVGGMADLRRSPEPTDADAALYQALDTRLDGIRWDVLRRNLLQRFVVDPSIARPERIVANPDVFGPSTETFRDRVEKLHAEHDTRLYSAVRPFSDHFLDQHGETLLDRLAELRGLAGEGPTSMENR